MKIDGREFSLGGFCVNWKTKTIEMEVVDYNRFNITLTFAEFDSIKESFSTLEEHKKLVTRDKKTGRFTVAA